jgi:hypothetical protein
LTSYINSAEQRKQVTEAFRGYAARSGATVHTEKRETDTAVSQTISALRAIGQERVVAVVKAVYFTNPTEPLHKHEIEDRVIAYSMTHYVSTASIYRWLSIARRIYWAILYHEVE